MSKIIIVTIEFHESNTGDRTAKVTSRSGSSGENPPTEVHHDSHFLESAVSELKKVVNRKIKEFIRYPRPSKLS